MTAFDWFQMVSLAVFLTTFLGRTLWLKREGIEVFTLGSGKKGFSAFLEKSFLVFFPLWIGEILIHSLHMGVQFLPDILVRPLFTGPLVQTAGAVLICGGILLFLLALISFKSSWRIGIDTAAPGGLVTTGVFSLSRNPIFLSMDLYFLGTFFIYSNLFFLVSFIGMALGFHLQIWQEERFLMGHYGDGYSAYMKRVHRYM